MWERWPNCSTGSPATQEVPDRGHACSLYPRVYTAASAELRRGLSMAQPLRTTAEGLESQPAREQRPLSGAFLATWKSLSVLRCTGELVSCLWATRPRMGKVLASSSSHAKSRPVAVHSQGDRRGCPTQASHPHPQHGGYPGFAILWHIPNSTFHYAE